MERDKRGEKGSLCSALGTDIISEWSSRGGVGGYSAKAVGENEIAGKKRLSSIDLEDYLFDVKDFMWLCGWMRMMAIMLLRGNVLRTISLL